MEEILRFEHVSYAYEEEREALLDVCVKVCAAPVRDASCFGARRWAAAQSS